MTVPAGIEPPLNPDDELLVAEFASQLDAAVVHIAGIDVTVGRSLRQLCAWCGAVLIDYRLDHIEVPVGQDPTPATWPVGIMVLVDGNMQTSLDDTGNLPDNACAYRLEAGERRG